MARLIKLAIVIGLAWAAYSYGWPFVQRLLNDPGTGMAGTPGVDKCIRSARAAVEYFGDEVVRFAQPPVDVNAWAGATNSVQGRVRTAKQACVCDERACDDVSTALDQLGDLVQSFDETVRRGQPLQNPGARISRIVDAIDDAERSG